MTESGGGIARATGAVAVATVAVGDAYNGANSLPKALLAG